MTDKEFWETKKLTEFTKDEWESVCDQCGKCCLLKLIDQDTEKVHYTNVTCHLLNTENCQCSNYENRKSIVPDCIKLTPENLNQLHWMPNSCSYRLLNEGKSLPDWHPLIQNSRIKMDTENHSIINKVISEKKINKKFIGNYIFDWDEKNE